MDFDAQQKQYGDEQVLVINKDVIPKIISLSEGYNEITGFEILDKLQNEAYFLPRYYVEGNSELNVAQIIPYITIGMLDSYFTYKRVKNGDYRGNGKISIGVGGHINLCDSKSSDGLIMAGAYRELREETNIAIANSDYLRPMGIIKCSSTNFDKDHLGIHFDFNAVVFNIDEIGEDKKLSPIGTINMNALKAFFYDSLENWSKIIVDWGLNKNE